MDESFDSIRDLQIFQPAKGYRFSIDSVLLGCFITRKPYKQAIEFGTGCGIISLILARELRQTAITAVEIQESLVKLAQKNAAINQVEHQITVVHEDINRLPLSFKPGFFDLAFANPPFRKSKTGKLSPLYEKSIARHEILIEIESLIKIASNLLNNRGTFALVYHPFRLVELILLLKKHYFEPKRMRFVHNRHNEPATMVLLESVKGAGTWLDVEPPLILRNDDGQYTQEVNRFLLG